MQEHTAYSNSVSVAYVCSLECIQNDHLISVKLDLVNQIQRISVVCLYSGLNS